MRTKMETINLNLLQHSWTAEVLLNNGQQISIWYTAWPMIKRSVKEVLSVSSDYPKYRKGLTFYKNIIFLHT